MRWLPNEWLTVTVHARHQSTASPTRTPQSQVPSNDIPAEFRGPGVRHQFDHDSPDEYELDLDHRPRGFGGRSGKIILLGDGTEVLTDSDDTEMFDQSEEDKDAANQVKKSTPDTSDVESARSEREGTPAPQSASDESKESSHHDASHSKDTEIKGIADNATEKKFA